MSPFFFPIVSYLANGQSHAHGCDSSQFLQARQYMLLTPLFLQNAGLRGVEGASDDLLRAVAGKGRVVSYARPGSEELRYLDFMHANANVGGEDLTHILLRQDPRKIEVLEEFLHGTQRQIGVIDRIGVGQAEVHVKDFMIRHQRLLGISPEDAAILQEMIGR